MYTLSIITVLTILPVSYSTATTDGRIPVAGRIYQGTYSSPRNGNNLTTVVTFADNDYALKMDFWRQNELNVEDGTPRMSAHFDFKATNIKPDNKRKGAPNVFVLSQELSPTRVELLKSRLGKSRSDVIKEFNEKFGDILHAQEDDFKELLYEPHLREAKSDRVVGDKDMSIMIGFDTAGGAVKIDFWHGQLPSIDYNEPDMSCFFACTLLHSHNPKVIELRERRGWQDRYKMEQFNNKFGSILVAGPNDFNKLLYEPSLPRMPKSDRIRLDIDGNVLDLVRCD
ncbi:hypothetical protein FOL47_004573 [Perkinsus chesapeaki]|uniref:Uncharacterized protein n=1 Tax=Perkinsus chesapeaki TaxID=330153 RepID=A0A7J6N085_PERCH|nr:hypothetical protein FOL47_004573 [Perkinsus chesapeaki]